MPLYFAYGSNLSVHQMERRCPNSKPLEIGCLKGYRLAFTHCSSGWDSGVADIVADPTQEVWGLIYKLSPEDLHRLDDYEGYPSVYTRFKTSIKTLTDNVPDVWVYTVVQKKSFVPPSKVYIELIKKSAIELGFPKTYRSYLDTIETIE
jgi:gamma-glutamylcyclotransferase (GGCT)/AIG2-like uncharacterized protein YtfP